MLENFNLIQIINEELNNSLNETFIMSDNKFTFKQRLNNSSFYNYSTFTTEFDSDILESDIVVSWKISFWLNDAGVQKFIVDVEKIEGTFLLQLLDLHSGEVKQETPKNIGEFDWKFKINEATLLLNGSLYISELSFDFKTKTCSITF